MHSTSLPRLLLATALGFASFAGIGVAAASAQVRDRITAAVSNSLPIAIPNSVHPKAALGTDLGPAAGNTKLSGMSIRFNMSDAQQAALDKLLADQQDPTSSRYHQWLTPAQYDAQFGMSSDDLAKVSGWLRSQGFTVTGVANGGTFVTFDGTVAQAQSAFGTSIHNVKINGETHFANVTNISVPSAFSDAVAAVTGLHNFRLAPRVHTSVVKPDFTSSVTGTHFVAPGDIYAIYNMNSLLNNSINGTGITIAVTGQVDIYPADVTAFRSAAGLSTTNLPTTIHAGTDPGYPVCTSCSTGANQSDLDESSIDVEWSGAMAPSATIDFVNGLDVINNAMTYAIDNNVAPIVTTSYGLCEAGWGSAELLALNALFKQANAQGQTVLAASADFGAADCDAGPSAIEGLTVDFPGSSPYVTSVGGTQFNEGSSTGTTQYWNSNSSSSTANAGSAISYIPEAVWNDEPGFDAFEGGGGGASAFFTKPAWQVGTGVPVDGARDVPDLALDASDAHDTLLYCVNVAQGTSCTSGFRVGSSTGSLNPAGGTSFDSQIFGGMLALVEQKIGGRIGNANQTIYSLANNTAYYTPGMNTTSLPTVVFNDVTTGNNSMPCTIGSPNCPNGGVIGFNAGAGYDQATGWGSVNVTNLANDWNLVTPLGIGTLGSNVSVTILAATPSSATAGATITLTATVTGTAGTPTGTVQFVANNAALGSPVAVTAASATSATASYSWVTSCSTLGQQVLSASYSGDSSYLGSKGPALTAGGGALSSNGSVTNTPLEVQVTSSTCPNFTLAASSSTVTVAAGGTIPPVTITLTPVNNFTGTVTFSGTATSATGYAPVLTFSPSSVNVTSSSPVTTSLTLSGIVANLRLPNSPGQTAPAIMLAQRRPASRTPWYFAGSGAAVASLLLIAFPRRRRLGGLLLVLLAVALIGSATGCSSSQSSPPTTTTTSNSNPYAGNYTVTVIANYTSSTGQVTQQTATVLYTIN